VHARLPLPRLSARLLPDGLTSTPRDRQGATGLAAADGYELEQVEVNGLAIAASAAVNWAGGGPPT
jgi:hypothetical protein